MKTSIVRHDTPTIILHWSVALLIVCASFSSFFLNSGGSDVSTTKIETFHNVTGTLALGLVIVWFGWRALHEEMPKLASISNNEHRFMELTNGVLKSLLLLVPATGIMHLFASGKSIDVGMLKLTYVISMTQQNFELLGLTHNVLGKLLLAVAFVHSAHALWHHFRRRDGFVRRILPWVAK